MKMCFKGRKNRGEKKNLARDEPNYYSALPMLPKTYEHHSYTHSHPHVTWDFKKSLGLKSALDRVRQFNTL